MFATHRRRHLIRFGFAGAALAVFACALVAAVPVRADSVTTTIQLDLNGLTLQARDAAGHDVAFGAGPFTGSLAFGLGGDANLNSVLIDGASRPEYHGVLDGVSGHLDFIGDAVSGGVLSVSVRNADATLDTYGLSFAPDSGSLFRATSGLMLRTVGHVAKGDTAGGTFDKATFGGVDVAPWFANAPVPGTFIALKYNPDANGFGSSVDLDLSATAPAAAAPLPSGAWGGLVLFAVLGAGRLAVVRRTSARSVGAL
jgi:hypothetical protein